MAYPCMFILCLNIMIYEDCDQFQWWMTTLAAAGFSPKCLSVSIMWCPVNSVLHVWRKNKNTWISKGINNFLLLLGYMYHLRDYPLLMLSRLQQKHFRANCHVIILKIFLWMLLLGGLYNLSLLLLFCHKYHKNNSSSVLEFLLLVLLGNMYPCLAWKGWFQPDKYITVLRLQVF